MGNPIKPLPLDNLPERNRLLTGKKDVIQPTLKTINNNIPRLEGHVPLNSEFYIARYIGYGKGRRSIESDCFNEIEQSGSLIRIRSPKQMGKTSLMIRIIDHVSRKNQKTVQCDFSEKELVTDQAKFLKMFCEDIGNNLGLSNQIDTFWTSKDNKVNCTKYFESHILNKDISITLALDNVDLIFDLPFAEQFFSLLRAWHERGKEPSSCWENLKIIIVHSTQLYIKLPENQSPFNVGLTITPDNFIEKEVKELVKCYKNHGLKLTANNINKLISLVNGHPFLINKVLFELAKRNITVDTFFKTAHTELGIYKSHLRRLLLLLEKNSELLSAMKTILTTKNATNFSEEISFKLEGLGLVKRQTNGVIITNQLYKKYFSDKFNLHG